jgi:response regulator RpfG family c-di-GMP phosphodiesterase
LYPANPHADKGCATIVVIDDDSSALRAIERILADIDIEVLSATSPEQGLKLLTECEPDIVISDYHMPGRNGVDVLEVAKSMHPRAIRILLTAGVSKEAVIDAINRAGIALFIEKPFDAIFFRSAIVNYSRYRQLERTNEKISTELEAANSELARINEMLELEVRKRTGQIMEREFHLRKLLSGVAHEVDKVIAEITSSESG